MHGCSSPPSFVQPVTEVMDGEVSEELPAGMPPTATSVDHPMEDAPPTDNSEVTSYSDEDGAAHRLHDPDLHNSNAILGNNPLSPEPENVTTLPATALPGDIQEHLSLETMLVDGADPLL
jgi:hypothetical protein